MSAKSSPSAKRQARTCLLCDAPFRGRPDKKYCSASCKNRYNHLRRRKTRTEVKRIDAFLHRNREIIEEILGKARKKMVPRRRLDRMGFRYSYITGLYFNKEGKMYRNVYNYAYMEFSDQEVLIVRRRSSA